MSPFSMFRRHPRGELTLYADGRLGPAEARRVEAHLAGCEACRADIEAQCEVRSLLQQAPMEPAPRSFALTPGMLQEPERRNIRAGAAPVAMGLRLASAGLALGLALVVFIDVNKDSGGGVSDKQAMETSADSAYRNDSASAPEAAGDAGGPASGPSTFPTPAPTGAAGGTGDGSGTGSGGTGGVTGVGGGEPPPSETAPPKSESPGYYAADVGEDDAGAADSSTALEREDETDGNGLLIVEAALIIALAAALVGSIIIARKARRD